MISRAIDELRGLGVEVSTDNEDRIAYSKDFNPLHQLGLLKRELPALPDAVAFPRSVEDVSKVLSVATKYGIPVYVFGAASGVIDSATPYEGGIALSTLSLDWIDIDEGNRLVTVGAGVIGGRLERFLNARGYSLRHIPQSLFCSSVGGWVATASSGQYSTGYGNIENLVVSLKVVLPNGEILEEPKTPRRAGPDLKRMFIGSEGLLGVIAEVTLKMFELPEEVEMLSFEYENIEEALRDARMFVSMRPALMRIFDDEESLRYFDSERFSLIMIFEGSGARQKAEEARRAASGSEVEGYTEKWLEKRFDVSDISRINILGFVFDTIEISCFWRSAAKVYASVVNAIRSVEGTVTASAHASHFYESGLCFYFTFAGLPEDAESYYREVWSKAIAASLRSGGNVTHHHGIGRLRRQWLGDEIGSYVSLLRDLKAMLDRRNIMNRGVLT